MYTQVQSVNFNSLSFVLKQRKVLFPRTCLVRPWAPSVHWIPAGTSDLFLLASGHGGVGKILIHSEIS